MNFTQPFRLFCFLFLTALFVNQITAYPISYERLYRPDDGRSVDLIGDTHVYQSYGESEKALLDTLKKLDKKDKKITILWEVPSRKDITPFGDRAMGANRPPMFLRDGYQDLKNELSHIKLVALDNRPDSFWLLRAARIKDTLRGNRGDEQHKSFFAAYDKYTDFDTVKIKDVVAAMEQALDAIEQESLVSKVVPSEKYRIDTIKKIWREQSEPLFKDDVYYKESLNQPTYELSIDTFGELLHDQHKRDEAYRKLSETVLLNMFDARLLASIFSSTNPVIVYAGALHTKAIAEELEKQGFIKLSSEGLKDPEKCMGSFLDPKLPDVCKQAAWKNLLIDPKDSYEVYRASLPSRASLSSSSSSAVPSLP